MEYKIYYYIREVEKILEGSFVPPVSCEVDPSNKCQLACSFCMYKDWRKEELVDLDYDVFKELCFDLAEGGTKSITFTGGGEPLMNKCFNDMAFHANQSFDIGLVTNGIFLDRLEPHLINEFVFIRISLDAGSSDVYKTVKGADYFDKVVKNLELILKWRKRPEKTTIGISYVICDENEKDIDIAKKMSEELGVDYIQFKPALVNGDNFNTYSIADSKTEKAQTILTNRFVAEDTLPCHVAGLVGIVAATGKVYFCCQHRGHEEYELGSLYRDQFHHIWSRRANIIPQVNKCAPCRYMNYAKKCALILGDKFSQEHKNFL